MVCKLLDQYELPSAFNLMQQPPGKKPWRHRVKRAILKFWHGKLSEDAAQKSSLQYMSPQSCKPGQVHPIWNCGSDPIQATMATVKARLLVQRYPLSGLKCAGKGYKQHCPLCNGPPESLAHFLLECPPLEQSRDVHLQRLLQELSSQGFSSSKLDTETLLRLIMEPSSLVKKSAVLESISRRLCFALHNERSVIVGTGTPAVAASRAARVGVGGKLKPKTVTPKSGLPATEAEDT
jgi:hypothetical protein